MRTYSEQEVQDLTDRVFLLRDRLAAGKVHIASHLIEGFESSFQAIRLRADGLVDPTTVDGRIRASTLAIKAFAYREEAKQSVSLYKIQTLYFDFLFREFDVFYEAMSKGGVSPATAAAVAAKDDKLVENVHASLPDLAEGLTEFWSSVADAAAYHLQDGQQLKATFSGDLFPAHWENVVSTAGLYIDTIVLPCPIMRIAPLAKALPAKKVVELLIKHVLTAMTYRDLAVADIEPPLVIISPNPKDLTPEDRSSLVEESQGLICRHADYLFGREFESVEHLIEYCARLTTVEQVIAELSGGDRLVFDTSWGKHPRDQLQMSLKEGSTPGLDASVAGNHVLQACFGRMAQALATQRNAIHYGGTPFVGVETSWRYLNWMLEYQGQGNPIAAADQECMHIARALSAEANNNLQWLGNVPPETVLQIRKLGLAEELRSLLGEGIAELVSIKPNNYFRTADKVVDNLDRAFQVHQAALKDARQNKLKLYGIDVVSCIAVGTISVAAALTANPILGAAGGLLGAAGLPNLRDIKTRYRQLKENEYARSITPTGLLFKHLDR